MPTMTSLDWIIILLVLTFGLYLYATLPKRLPLPPGPKRLPFIGNLLDMPTKSPWKTYHAWAKEFNSSVVYLDVAGTDIIVLDSAEAAYELLEKKSTIYSSRPRMPMVRELMGWDWLLSTMPYDVCWLEHRKLFRQEFSPTCTPRYYPQQLEATHELLRRLTKTPDDFEEHIRHTAGQLIMSVTYGIDVLHSHDPYIDRAEEAIAAVTAAAIPGTFLVDALPVLKYLSSWLPGAAFKLKAREWRKQVIALVDLPFEEVKANMAQGVARLSITSSCLQAVNGSDNISHQEQVIKNIAATVYIGGADTTVSSMCSFILAMVLYPNVQQAAQKELDAVLGTCRLPTFEDEDALPYISAIVKEILRWRPVLPICVPHLLQVDDTCRGYRIPKGSICVPNAWAILQNEITYPEPLEFKPERFLKDGKLNSEVRDPTAAFGFGRRICPGRFTAQSQIWIVVGSILSCFDISKAIDENGSTIEPSGECDSLLVCHPLPLKCSIKPRSSDVLNLILSNL